MTKKYYRYDPDTGKKEWSEEVDFVSTDDVKDSTGDSTTHPMSQKAVTESITPIGMCYTQYPGTETPSDLFGGTWTLMFNTEGVFFRTEGQGASSFGGGVQGDAIRNISGIFSAYSYEDGGPSGPFRSTISNTSQLGADNPIETRNYIRFSFDASREVPTA